MDAIKLERDEREAAVKRIQAYFERERDEELGELGATLMLDFVAEELGPLFYNRGLDEAQRLLRRLADSLDADLDAAKRLPPRAPGA